MSHFFLGARSRYLALALTLVGSLVAGCGQSTVKVSNGGASQGPPPTTEKGKKAAAFSEKLKAQTQRD